MQHLATGVVQACEDLSVAVVSNATEVVAWARDLELAVIADPGSLDGAASAAVAWARSQSFARVIVIHADLPLASTLRPVLTTSPDEGLIAVSGLRDRGTPVLSIPARCDFTFSYGPGSLDRHVAEAVRLGLPSRVVENESLGTDLDVAEDFERFAEIFSHPLLTTGGSAADG